MGIVTKMMQEPTERMNRRAVRLILLRLGGKENVKRVHEFCEMCVRSGYFEDPMEEAVLKYYCGQGSAEDVVRTAGGQKKQLCLAYYNLGLWSLGTGNRDQAIKELRDCVDAGAFVRIQHNWAEALLVRLEKYPDWPGYGSDEHLEVEHGHSLE